VNNHTLLLLLSCLATFSAVAADAEPPPPFSSQSAPGPAKDDGAAPTGTPPAKQGSQKIYRDPVTGEFTAPPPHVPTPAVTTPERIVTPSAPHMQTPSAAPGGGVMMDVEGRFRSYTSATKDENGEIGIHCHTQSLTTPAD
jgi:hypothetical protein